MESRLDYAGGKLWGLGLHAERACLLVWRPLYCHSAQKSYTFSQGSLNGLVNGSLPGLMTLAVNGLRSMRPAREITRLVISPVISSYYVP